MAESVINQVKNKSNIPKKEDIFAQIVGQFGTWQFLIFSTLFLIKLSSAWTQLSILFLTPKYEFHCAELGETSLLFDDADNSSLIFENPMMFEENASFFGENTMFFGVNSTMLLENSTCYKDCLRYEYDTSPMDNTIVSEWNLICERRWLASFTQTMTQCGILLGSFVFGYLADRYGRKSTFLASVTIMTLVGFAIPFSPNYTVFTILRFISGFGTAGTMTNSFVIIMETVGPDYRELCGCLYVIPFAIGQMSVAVFAYFFRTWQSFLMSMAVPQVLYIGYFFILSESPRWLVSVGRVDEATKIAKRAASINKLPTDKIEETLTKLSQEMQNIDEPNVTYMALFHRSLVLKSLCCCFMWLVAGVTYYGYSQYVSQTSSNPYIVVIMAGAVQIPTTFVVIWGIRHLGRKKTTIGLFFFGGICILPLNFVPENFWTSLILGILGVCAGGAVATTIYIYTTELFPTVVRNMGMGACSTSMRIGSMVAPFISSLLVTVPWLPPMIFGLGPIIAGLICLLLPETRGTNLPDTIEDLKMT